MSSGAESDWQRKAESPAPSEDAGSRPDEAELVELASRMFALARSGGSGALERYLSAGLPADLSNDRGDTLLMLAAYHGHAATVRVLLAHGADPNRPNDRGQTPLAGAVFKGEDDVVRALAGGGADPRVGHPSAVEAARMFAREDYLAVLGVAGNGPA